MAKEMQIFENPELGSVRVIEIDGEPWFVGKDVAIVLGYGDADQALRKHVDGDDRLTRQIEGTGQSRNMTTINESGLYSLVLSSKLPSAKKFKRWVTSEVLPCIRRNGGYLSGQETLTDDELLERAVMVAQRKIAERDKVIAEKDAKIREMRPKEVFADAVAVSRTSILVGDLAKLIAQNGVDIGQKRLFAWMRDNGYL
ncbi:MAG: phage repressor protein/antirepressor Ant, partial [Lachnospiraceae bacterium]|nr:phage repressor protein/antirepressor Ant [Lachnospiraceae bacterium]